MKTLAEDRLPSIKAIAQYTGDNERRIRHLINAHNFPHIKVGERIESRRSWVNAYYDAKVIKAA